MKERDYSVTSQEGFLESYNGTAIVCGNTNNWSLVHKVVLFGEDKRPCGFVSLKKMDTGLQTLFQLSWIIKGTTLGSKLLVVGQQLDCLEVKTLCAAIQGTSLHKETIVVETVQGITIFVSYEREGEMVAADMIVLDGVKAVEDINGGHKLIAA